MVNLDGTVLKKDMEGELEFALFSSLKQVEPDPKFVMRVRERIERKPTTVIESRSFWETYVIVACGLFFGAVVVWLTGRRHPG
jgi:hypothetical protein